MMVKSLRTLAGFLCGRPWVRILVTGRGGRIGSTLPSRAGDHGFEPRSSQTNDLKIDTCRLLARCLALLGQNKDWLVHCQDNVTEWGIGSRYWWPGFPVGQH